MKRHKYFRPAALFTVLMSVAGFWWACNFEQVGPKEPPSMKLTEILAQLENSQSPVEAEMAIQHLVAKTGIGIEIKGSNYGEYYLPDNFAVELAEAHLRYLSGERDKNWAEAFELEKAVSEERWAKPLTFEDIAAALAPQAQAALADPESPNHALVLAMLASGTALPSSIAAPAPTDLISPVQEFLFEAWMEFQYGDLPILQKKKPNGYTHFEFTFVQCVGNKTIITKQKVKVGWYLSSVKKCLEAARKKYETAVKACLSQDKKCRKTNPPSFCCLQLKQCVEAAYNQVQLEIQSCLKHDQGGN